MPTLIALSGTLIVARWQHRGNQETNRIATRNASVAETAARNAERSTAIADRAAAQSRRAADQLNSFRLHDDTMRTLYWAADHAIVPDSARALLGLEVLGALLEQAEGDIDYRGRKLVQATSAAVITVAIPTFLSVLTSAVKEDDETGDGVLRLTSVELNAAKLLLAHGHDLDQGLRAELERLAHGRVGSMVVVRELHSARHLDARLEAERDRQLAIERSRLAGPSLGR